MAATRLIIRGVLHNNGTPPKAADHKIDNAFSMCIKKYRVLDVGCILFRRVAVHAKP